MLIRLVLVHSSGLGARQWRIARRVFGDRFEVVAPDLTGYGETPWDSSRPALEADVELVADLLDVPCALVGHSYGAAVAIHAALRRPDAVGCVVAFEPTLFGLVHDDPDPELRAELDVFDGDPLFLDRARGGDARWLERFVDYWNGPGAWAGMYSGQRDALLAVGRKVFSEVTSVWGERTPLDRYRELKMPLVVAAGEHSTRAARAIARRLSANVPGSELDILPRAGHMAPLTHQRPFHELVERHLVARLSR